MSPLGVPAPLLAKVQTTSCSGGLQVHSPTLGIPFNLYNSNGLQPSYYLPNLRMASNLMVYAE